MHCIGGVEQLGKAGTARYNHGQATLRGEVILGQPRGVSRRRQVTD